MSWSVSWGYSGYQEKHYNGIIHVLPTSPLRNYFPFPMNMQSQGSTEVRSSQAG
jgi:hypothetical protein